MKKLINLSKQKLLIALLIITFHSIGQNLDYTATPKIKFSIHGEIENFKDSAVVWLGLSEPYELKGMAFKGKVVDGKFNIIGETFNPTIGKLSLFLPNNNYINARKVDFCLCEGDNKVILNESFEIINISNGCQNEQKRFEDLNDNLSFYDKELEQLYKDQFHFATTNEEKYIQVSKKIDSINKLTKPIYTRYIKEEPSSFFSAVLFDLIYTYNKNDIVDAEKLFSSFVPKIKESLLGKEILRKLDVMKSPSISLVGKPMIDAELIDLYGNKKKLSSFKGKLLLLDFWASWCGPCRKSHPELKKMYEKYGNEKFEIISISIDKDKTKWMEAIKEDKIDWPQLIDNRISSSKSSNWHSEAFLKYKGVSVPLTLIVDPNGLISELNPSKERLELVLKALHNY